MTNIARTSEGDRHIKASLANEAAIILAYPTGTIGDLILNQETDTLWTWDSDTSAWVDTGGDVNVVLSISGTPAGGDRISNIISLTTAEYTAISGSENASTLYILTD